MSDPWEELRQLIKTIKPLTLPGDAVLQEMLDTIPAHMHVTVVLINSETSGKCSMAVPTSHLNDVLSGSKLRWSESLPPMVVQHGGVLDVADVLQVWM